MRRRGWVAAATAGLLLALAGAGCGGAGASKNEVAGGGEDASIQVVTTTNFITDIVAQVGGDRVGVTGLMGPGIDPHLYKASAGDVGVLRDADAIFYGGLFLEGKMADVLDELGEEIPAVAVSERIPEGDLLDPPPGAAPEEEHDPHVWFDPGIWAHAVTAVRDELTELDPEGADLYRANTERLLAEMRELERYGRTQIGSIPAERRVLVTSHDAFQYFGRAFGIDVFAIQGISTAAEATTSDVDRIAELVAERGVRSVFVESSVPAQTIDAVVAAAEQQGQAVEVGGELFSDAAGEQGTAEGTYIGMVRSNIDAVTKGLK